MIEEPIAGVDDLDYLSPHCEMSDDEFAEICRRIEWHQSQVQKYQRLYRSQTGRDYVSQIRMVEKQ